MDLWGNHSPRMDPLWRVLGEYHGAMTFGAVYIHFSSPPFFDDSMMETKWRQKTRAVLL